VKSSSQETVTHFKCPKHVERELRLAGGENPFGEPMFRVVWGYDRIVPIHGEWQEWETYRATLTDKVTGISRSRDFMRLKRSVIETRHLPKYLPRNCWHLEKWFAVDISPEEWKKLGQETIGGMLLDASGPYPERGEYELCYPLTSDGTADGVPIPLVTDMVVEICNRIRRDHEASTPLLVRRAAIEQRELKKEEGLVKRMRDMLKDGLKPFAGETFVTVPESTKGAV
jgi:hypothetical protein